MAASLGRGTRVLQELDLHISTARPTYDLLEYSPLVSGASHTKELAMWMRAGNSFV